MKKVIGSLVLLLAFQGASASDLFEIDVLQSEDSQTMEVCKVMREATQYCIPRARYFDSKEDSFVAVPTIDLVEAAKLGQELKSEDGAVDSSADLLGGGFAAAILEDEKLKFVLENFRQISVRNIGAVDIHSEQDLHLYLDEQAQVYRFPILFDVYWKGNLGTEGTLHVEGELVFDQNDKNEGTSNGLDQIFAPDIVGFADSLTEQNKAPLRRLETASRMIHFSLVEGEGSTDDKTMRLLSDIVGPFVTNEVYVAPLFAGIAEAFGVAIGEVLKEVTTAIIDSAGAIEAPSEIEVPKKD